MYLNIVGTTDYHRKKYGRPNSEPLVVGEEGIVSDLMQLAYSLINKNKK